MDTVGLISVKSTQSVPATVDSFVAAAKQAGLAIFGQRDYANIAQGPQPLRPAVLVLFGNPHVIARLVAANPQVGIDLPMKTIVWEDADGKTTIGYNDPRWLLSRHGLSEQFGELSNKMASVLEKIIKNACSEKAE